MANQRNNKKGASKPDSNQPANNIVSEGGDPDVTPGGKVQPQGRMLGQKGGWDIS